MSKSKIKVVRKKKTKRLPLKDQPYDLNKDGVTQSTLVSYEACRMRCKLTLDGWRSQFEKESAVFGQLFHGLLEHLYRGISTGDIKKKDVYDFFQAFVKRWVKDNESKRFSDATFQTIHFLTVQAEPVFMAYCDQWPEDFKRKLWRELEGKFDVRWNGFRLRGMRDGLQLLDGDTSKPRMLETKTKAQIPTNLDLTLRYNTQNLFYLTSLNADFKALGLKKRVEKVLYNIIRRPGLAKPKVGGSWTAYKKKIKDHINAKGPDHYFKRMELRYPKKDQDRFAEELLERLTEFEAWRDEVDRGKSKNYPTFRNDMACEAKFRCPFIDACATGSMEDYAQTGLLFPELED